MNLQPTNFSSAGLHLICLWATSIAVAADQEQPPQVRLISQPASTGGLLRAADDQFEFGIGDGRQTFGSHQLVSWGHPVASRSAPIIIMAGGDRLVLKQSSELRRIEQDRVHLQSDLWGEVQLPLQRVRGCIFRRPMDVSDEYVLADRVANFQGRADEIWTTNGDVVQGVLTRMEGNQCTFRSPAGELSIGLDRIQCLALSPTLGGAVLAADRPIRVGLRDGSLLNVRSIMLSEQTLQLTMSDDVVLQTDPIVRPVEEEIVTFLRPQNPAVTYLSQLTPTDYRHIPYLMLDWPYGVDRNLFGGPLMSGGEIYASGIAMHSTSRLTYLLDGTHQRFEAELALDDGAGQGGSVIFRVYLHVDESWQEAYTSPVVRGRDPTRSCVVDLKSAKELALVVDFADRADELDYANWLDARLVRAAANQ